MIIPCIEDYAYMFTYTEIYMPRIVNIDEYAKLREQNPNLLGAGNIGIPNFIELTKCYIINGCEMEVEPILINITSVVMVGRDVRDSTTFDWKGGSTLVLNGMLDSGITLNVFESYSQIISLMERASYTYFRADKR